MIKSLSLLIMALMISIGGYSQAPIDTAHHWKVPVLTQLNFNQVALSNWQGGGQNTIAGSGFLHAGANYKKNLHEWWNKLDAGFGMTRLGDKHQPFQKTDDELSLSSGYARDITKVIKYVLTFDAKTTFAPGYKYGKDSAGKTVAIQKLSDFMSPGYFLLGTGLAYKPNDTFLVVFSPLTARLTVLTNDSMANAGAYGVPAGHHMRLQFGEDLKIGIRWPVMKNVLLETSLDMFGDYKHLSQQVIDWPLSITFKVNNVFSATAGTHLIYDQDIQVKRDDGTTGPAVQFKELIAIGLQYKMH
jgi:hypothetical protein